MSRGKILHIIQRATNNDVSSAQSKWLLSLVPSLEETNRGYVKQLRKLIKNKDVDNIALTGGFGTGKSSILKLLNRGFFWKLWNGPKQISFMTLNSLSDSENSGEDGKKSLNSSNSSKKNSLHEMLQTEIFKQLYFGVGPNRLKRSRYFHVNRRPRLWLTFLVAFVASIVLAQLKPIEVWLSIQDGPFATTVFGLWPVRYVSVSIYFALCFVGLWMVGIFINDHPIAALGIKDLSVDLNDEKPDFDQMLDEIIYALRKSWCRVVILEDLDRFGDVTIYEDLCHLCHTINNYANNRVGLRFHRVTFVYAIKDSLIGDLENRVKLFDAVVPVVPFISEENNLAYVRESFLSLGFASDDIKGIDRIIADNIFDMRSIKMIANTSFMMKEKLRDGLTQGYLTYNEMVAMAVIREVASSEYESIRKGEGELRDVYKKCLILREETLEKIEQKLENRRNTKKLLEENKCTILKEIEGKLNPMHQDGIDIVFDVDNETVSEDYLVSEAFIRDMREGGILTARRKPSQRGYVAQREELYEYEDKDLRAISNAFCILMDICEKTVEEYESEVLGVKQSNIFFEYENMKEHQDKIGGSVIIPQLITGGFISQNYRLYLSPYSKLDESLELKKFRYTCLAQEIPDYTYMLEDIDVNVLINEENRVDLSSPAFYNISIIKWLLYNKDERILSIFNGRNRNRTELLKFYTKWSFVVKRNIERADESNDVMYICEFTEHMARFYPEDTLMNIVNNTVLGDSTLREELFVSAFSGIDDFKKIRFRDGLDGTYFEYYADSIVKRGLGKKLVDVLSFNDQKVTNLDCIGGPTSEVVQYAIRKGCFSMRVENLRFLNEDEIIRWLERDDINESDFECCVVNAPDEVLQYVARNILDYVDVIQNGHGMQRIANTIRNNRIRISVEGQRTLFKKYDDPMIAVQIMLASRLEAKETREVLNDLGNPYDRLTLPGIRPKIPKNKLNIDLSKRLVELGMVTSYKLERNCIRVCTKKV